MERDPVCVRRELTRLIQKQIDAIKKETFGGATETERREYDERRHEKEGAAYLHRLLQSAAPKKTKAARLSIGIESRA